MVYYQVDFNFEGGLTIRIVVDVDDCLNNLMSRTIEMFNSRTGKNYDLNVFTEYNIRNCVPKNDADLIFELFAQKDLWDSLIAPNDAQEAIKSLAADGHEIYVASSCFPHTWGWKTDWLQKNYPEIPSTNYICIANKWLLNCDVLIDDNPEHLRRGMYTTILRTEPWNLHCRDTWYDYRADTMMDAIRIIKTLD